jgi:hypothetical protein
LTSRDKRGNGKRGLRGLSKAIPLLAVCFAYV